MLDFGLIWHNRSSTQACTSRQACAKPRKSPHIPDWPAGLTDGQLQMAIGGIGVGLSVLLRACEQYLLQTNARMKLGPQEVGDKKRGSHRSWLQQWQWAWPHLSKRASQQWGPWWQQHWRQACCHNDKDNWGEGSRRQRCGRRGGQGRSQGGGGGGGGGGGHSAMLKQVRKGNIYSKQLSSPRIALLEKTCP